MVIVGAIDSYNKKSIFTFLKYNSTEATKRSCSSHKTIREQDCFHFLQKNNYSFVIAHMQGMQLFIKLLSFWQLEWPQFSVFLICICILFLNLPNRNKPKFSNTHLEASAFTGPKPDLDRALLLSQPLLELSLSVSELNSMNFWGGCGILHGEHLNAPESHGLDFSTIKSLQIIITMMLGFRGTYKIQLS